LGKPADLAEAGEMIRALNGRTHQVFTAVCIQQKAEIREVELGVTTDVTFKSLSDAGLDEYHSMIEPLDKAGAYAAQDHGERIIESIDGSRTNVVGLPMDEVIVTLRDGFRLTPKTGS
ncbi:MAG: Maf family protein, partial [Verrucomicrobiales bacterium]|nr:Maf family protein [Verrucomicrobiales bacterium]